MARDDIITPTTDLFIASLWSAPKNEPILRSLLNAVMTDIGLPTIVEAKVLNPFNIREYPTDKQIRLDVLVCSGGCCFGGWVLRRRQKK
jgi:hypothetical protein